MRLSLPTDRLILEELATGRNLAANIHREIDKSRNHVNERMGYLHDYQLVERVGPAQGTGLYELTARGAAVVATVDQYEPGSDYERLVDERAEQIELVPFHVIDHAADE